MTRKQTARGSVLFLGAWMALAGCESNDELLRAGGESEIDELGRAEAELRGESDGTECTPFMLAHFDRGHEIAAALTYSTAFANCLYDRISESYMDCQDDATFSGAAAQRNGILNALRNGNHIRLNCVQRVGGACGTGGSCPAGQICRDGYCGVNQDLGYYGFYGIEDPVLFDIGSHWTNGHWAMSIAPQLSSNPGYPWGAAADTVLHEFSHTHAYYHVDGSAQAACATANGRPNYYAKGEPSMPYIVGECAGTAVQSVYNQGYTMGSCGPDQIPVPSSYNETLNDPHVGNSTLAGYSGVTCVRVPRRRAWFRAGDGSHYFQAYNQGGGAFNAQSVGAGDWERLYVIDYNGGTLNSGDMIALRTANSRFVHASSVSGGQLTASATSDADTLAKFYIYRVSGSGPIVGGTSVHLRSVGRGRYVTAVNNGGSTLVSDATTPSTWETFTFEEPRRAFLVSFRTASEGRAISYVPGTPNGELRTRTPAAVGSPQEREEYFWVYDHSGGALYDGATGLSDGDTISLEWAGDSAYVTWSTCTSGYGNVRGDGFYMNPCQRFRIDREAGIGLIRNGDRVYLSSVGQSRWLTAVPSTYGDPNIANRIRNDRSTAPCTGCSSANNWERLTIRFAQGDAFYFQ